MKDLINYDDFTKLEIRVGKIIGAEAPVWSEKLIRYTIDFGGEIGVKTLFSGIRSWYTPEDLVGKKVPVILNMTPKKMGDYYSEGMVLMVDTDDKPIMIYMPEETPVGSLVR